MQAGVQQERGRLAAGVPAAPEELEGLARLPHGVVVLAVRDVRTGQHEERKGQEQAVVQLPGERHRVLGHRERLGPAPALVERARLSRQPTRSLHELEDARLPHEYEHARLAPRVPQLPQQSAGALRCRESRAVLLGDHVHLGDEVQGGGLRPLVPALVQDLLRLRRGGDGGLEVLLQDLHSREVHQRAGLRVGGARAPENLPPGSGRRERPVGVLLGNAR
mmetsp:Transcript_51456/g.161719  ORF Transcript_51456/g.161719 Transcript_51456/m.161719 type:complete len:221 (+) Transcript_51456:584-1246(+)